jgi:hypothetical protein
MHILRQVSCCTRTPSHVWLQRAAYSNVERNRSMGVTSSQRFPYELVEESLEVDLEDSRLTMQRCGCAAPTICRQTA